MDSEACENHDFCNISYESSLGSSSEMDSENCKNHDFCIILYESSPGGSKLLLPNCCYYYYYYYRCTTATATTAAAAAKMVCFQCQERQSKPLGKALLHALSNHTILHNVVRFSVSGASIQALETWQKSRFFNEVVCFQIRERQSKRLVTL